MIGRVLDLLRAVPDMRILVIEDNIELANWLQRNLRKEQYTVDWIDNGADADFALRSEKYDLVILDLALPRMNGREVLQRLRSRQDATPVLVLTANNTIQSRVSELDEGADDYMAKPFEVEELEARIRMLLRRSSGQSSPVIACSDLSYNTNTREFRIDQKPLALTPRERAVLEVLMRKAGATVTKQALAQSLFSLDEDVSTDAIEIYVHRLRKKLESSSARIMTLRGLGYLLRPAGDD
jgi:two-component system, OmpR family, response regulator TctD